MNNIYAPGHMTCGYTLLVLGHFPKCMSYHKAIGMITGGVGRVHCFHDFIYITLILFLWDLNTLCGGSLMTNLYYPPSWAC